MSEEPSRTALGVVADAGEDGLATLLVERQDGTWARRAHFLFAGAA